MNTDKLSNKGFCEYHAGRLARYFGKWCDHTQSELWVQGFLDAHRDLRSPYQIGGSPNDRSLYNYAWRNSGPRVCVQVSEQQAAAHAAKQGS